MEEIGEGMKVTYTVRLFNVGVDVPVAVYQGCTDPHTQSGAESVFIFTRADGRETKTNLRFETILDVSVK